VHTWRRYLLHFVGTIAALVLVAILLAPLIPVDRDGTRAVARSRGRPPAKAQLSLVAGVPDVRVPRSFLGISTEYWSLPMYERRLRPFERIVALLHVRGDGPFVLRVGGDSADQTFWRAAIAKPPPGAFTVTRRWLARTRTLVRQQHVRLILDLNLLSDSPFTAAEWARAAYRALPRRTIVGFEVGNEPDIYSRHYWLAMFARSGFGARVLPLRLSATQYASDFVSDAQAIRQVAPGIPIVGPALANPRRDAFWVPRLLAVAGGQLAAVTAHRYPFSACVKPRSDVFPTIARVLSERASAGLARALSNVIGIAHHAGLPFRLTELNSVTCGGRRGVSNTFATALWAPDALFELLRAGVDGVNVHVRAGRINAAFVPRGNGLQAQPLLYGMVLFARTLGPGARLVPSRLTAPQAPDLKAWTVRLPGTFHVLLINKGRRAASVLIRIHGTAPALVQRLSAPSVRATVGVELAGQQLGPDGRWQGRRDSDVVKPGKLGYRVTVSGISAALVSIAVPHAIGFQAGQPSQDVRLPAATRY
jgi:hypothetical protein